MIDFLVQPVKQGEQIYLDMVLQPGSAFATTTAISQKVLITFATWLGDWFFNLNFGIDYPNLKGNLRIEEVGLKIQSKILAIAGVIAITSFKYTYNNNRVYSFSAQYKTTDNLVNTITGAV